MAGQLDEAKRALTRTLELDPTFTLQSIIARSASGGSVV
jgi:hypothetical protein